METGIIPSQQLTGPYEQWVYGPGKPFTLPDTRFGRYRHLSSIVQLNSPVSPSDLVNPDRGDQPQPIWFHSYWNPEGKPVRLSYFPFALLPVDSGRVALTYEAIIATLSQELFLSSGIVEKSVDVHRSESAEDRKTAEDATDAGGSAIGGYRINVPISPESFDEDFDPATQPAEPAEACSKSGNAEKDKLTIVGVIDDGIPFAHRHLRDKCGKTRVERIWLQDASLNPDKRRRSVLYGRELTGDEIDCLIKRNCGDEDAVYRASGGGIPDPGKPRPISALASHGANVIDQMAGCGLHTPADEKLSMENVRIVAVQLPGNVTLDTSGFGKEAHILAAMHYIFIQADKIAEEYGYKADETAPPLILNFSYGFTGGPHDGLDRIERAMCELVGERRKHCGPTALVVPSGNTFLGRLNGVVENGAFSKGPVEIRWRIQPDDRTSNYCEIWLAPDTDIGKLSFQVVNPSGKLLAESVVAKPGEKGPPRRVGRASQTFSNVPIAKGGRVLGSIGIENFDSYRWRILFSLAPSEAELESGTTSAPAEPGVYTIRIAKADDYELPGPIECRIQRDLDPVAYRYGARQSYFEDSAYALFDDTGKLNENYQDAQSVPPFVRRKGTVNGIATHKRVLVTGGFYEPSFDPQEGSGFTAVPASYSTAAVSEEPSSADLNCLAQNSPAVHISVSTERSNTVGGITAGGTRSGSYVTLSGTSAAAPFVARQLALAFQEPTNREKSDPQDNYLSLLTTGSEVFGDFLRLGKTALHRQYRQW